MSLGILVRGVQTRWGYFMDGMLVEILRVDDRTADVCFDLDHHPTNICHHRIINSRKVRLYGQGKHRAET